MLLLGIICLVLGVIYIISPKTGWKICKGWQPKNTEPTDTSLVWGRVSGVLLVVVAVILFVKYNAGA